jgi:hypothetical protein
MKKCLIIAFVVMIFINTSLFACTVFYYSNGKIILAGNNEDWRNPFTKIWFLPAEDGKYGRIYFGYHDGVFQGGMNEQGLFYDGLATRPLKVTKSLDKAIYKGNLIDKAMAECATVEEVIKVFDQYNLEFMETFMLFFGDKTGNSIIIEGDEIIRKKGKYQISTNFYQSRTKADEYPCDRYKIANEMFENAEQVSVDYFRRILAATHQEGRFPTQYSNIYDLKQGIVYIYHFHNFENVVRLDLQEELKKGKRSIDLPSLFPRTIAAQRFKEKIISEQDELLSKKAAINVNPKIYDLYVGQYKLVHPELSLAIKINITKDGDKLYCHITDMEKYEIHPESETHFFCKTSYEILELTFIKDNKGQLNELVLNRWGIKYPAKRIK